MENKNFNYFIKGENFSSMRKEGEEFIVMSQIGKEVERRTFASYGYASSKHAENTVKIRKLK